MQIVINNIKMPIKHNTDDALKTAREIVRSNCISAMNFRIYKQSIDARRKNNIHYVYAVIAETNSDVKVGGDIKVISQTEKIDIPQRQLKSRPVVVGMGPCGLFAALILARSQNPPLILERGGDVDSRTESVKKFWETGVLDTESNVQFGEGGAGTFSDGKLNTRVGDIRQRFVLETLVEFGAPCDILYKAKPHVGTDMLCGVIKRIREHLIELGAEIKFNTCVTDVKIKNGKVCGVEINGGEVIECTDVVMAIGHSSRDTYKMLNGHGIDIEPKAFAIGARIEHSQSFIDSLQYGAVKGLPPADYRVVYNGEKRSCYSFCMCPGGVVVNASSENEMLAVNGMSEHKRDGVNANSALVVTVTPDDFESGALGGVEFQRKYERIAFAAGGGKAPVQTTADFIKDRKSAQLGKVLPSVKGGYVLADLRECLPAFVTDTLKEGLLDFERRMHGFGMGGVLTGVETRTSAPIRILRDESMQSTNTQGLYPAGEGAGYAGGIVSAALDGIRTALALLYKQ